MPGMNNATYDGATSSVRIGYCGSESNEAQLRTVLQPTWLLAE